LSSSGKVKGIVGPTPWHTKYTQTGQFPFGGTAAMVHEDIMAITKAQYDLKIQKMQYQCWTTVMGMFFISFLTAASITGFFWLILGTIYFGIAIIVYMSIYLRLNEYIFAAYSRNFAGKPIYIFSLCLVWIGVFHIINEHSIITDLKRNFTIKEVMDS